MVIRFPVWLKVPLAHFKGDSVLNSIREIIERVKRLAPLPALCLLQPGPEFSSAMSVVTWWCLCSRLVYWLPDHVSHCFAYGLWCWIIHWRSCLQDWMVFSSHVRGCFPYKGVVGAIPYTFPRRPSPGFPICSWPFLPSSDHEPLSTLGIWNPPLGICTELVAWQNILCETLLFKSHEIITLISYWYYPQIKKIHPWEVKYTTHIDFGSDKTTSFICGGRMKDWTIFTFCNE